MRFQGGSLAQAGTLCVVVVANNAPCGCVKEEFLNASDADGEWIGDFCRFLLVASPRVTCDIAGGALRGCAHDLDLKIRQSSLPGCRPGCYRAFACLVFH